MLLPLFFFFVDYYYLLGFLFFLFIILPLSSTTIILTHHSILSLHMVWGVSHLWRCWFPTHTPHLCLVYPTGVSDHPRPRTGIPVTLLSPEVVQSVQLWRLWDSGPRNNSLSLWDSNPRGMSPSFGIPIPAQFLGFEPKFMPSIITVSLSVTVS